MKPYQTIQDSKKVLKTLVNEAKTMDNVKTRLTELNTLIRLVNSFEEMLNKKYFTEYFDILLLSKMYQFFINNKVYEGNEIPIKAFTHYLRQDIALGKDNAKSELIGMLQGCQLNGSLKRGVVEFDKVEHWDSILEKYLSDIKQDAYWEVKDKIRINERRKLR